MGEVAAVRLQAFFRGYLVRKDYRQAVKMRLQAGCTPLSASLSQLQWDFSCESGAGPCGPSGEASRGIMGGRGRGPCAPGGYASMGATPAARSRTTGTRPGTRTPP